MCTLGLLCVHRRNAICRDLGLQGVRLFIPAVWHCNGLQWNFVHTLCSTSAVFSRHGSQLVPSYRAVFIAGSSRLQWVPSEQWLGVYGLCQLDSNQRLSTTRRHVNCLMCIVYKNFIVACLAVIIIVCRIATLQTSMCIMQGWHFYRLTQLC